MSEILSIQESWKLIHDTLGEFTPQRLRNLQAPAEEAAITQLAEKLQHRLPESLEASLKIHNGEDWQDQGILSRAWNLLSVEGIISEYNSLIYNHFSDEAKAWDEQFGTTNEISWDDPKLFSRVKKTMYDPAWIPFAHSGGGNYLCIDLAPERKGKQGQIIRWIKFLGPDRIIAPNYQSYLSAIAHKLERSHQK